MALPGASVATEPQIDPIIDNPPIPDTPLPETLPPTETIPTAQVTEPAKVATVTEPAPGEVKPEDQPIYDPAIFSILNNVVAQNPPTSTMSAPAPAEPLPVDNPPLGQFNQLSPEQRADLKDINPELFANLERENLEQSLKATLTQEFDVRLKSQVEGLQVEHLLDQTYPDYKNPNSQFRSDFNALINQAKDKSPWVRLAVGALIEKMTQSPKKTQAAIAAAKITGAVDERNRQTVANNAVVSGNPLVSPNVGVPDAKFVADCKLAGADPNKAWERFRSRMGDGELVVH